MTDIFTHSVIISNLSQHWRNGMNILDIGTGHGYLSFLIANILNNKGFSDYSVVGVDIHAEAIKYCQ
jgi:methylase of polypeptide subunit release factors